MCDVLKEIYRKVYEEPFIYSQLDNRIKLQKAVYLLENMGLHVGDYSFSWNKYGPYSLALDSDAQNCSLLGEQSVVFSDFAEKNFEKLRGYIAQKIVYNCTQWMECITSLYYLKNIYRYSEDKLISELVERKPYLSNEQANLTALSIIKKIKVGS